jgi:DNA-damage-inducible protein J
MALDAVVRARVDAKLKADVEVILKKVGLNTSQAINIFLNSIRNNNGIELELKAPSERLDQALDEIKQSKIQKFNTMEELRKDLLY